MSAHAIPAVAAACCAFLVTLLPAAAAPSDPNDPGIVEPVLTALGGMEVRIPHTDQATGNVLLNMVGPVVATNAAGQPSLLGHLISDLRSPNRALRDALQALADATDTADAPAMLSQAREIEDILFGTTEGRLYDGFAMLNFNRGAFVSDHVPGEYKMKTLVDSGLMAPGMDGQSRRIWEVSVNFLWYDGNFDADTFLLRVPVEAEPFDTLRVHYRIFAQASDDFAPTVVLLDHRAEGSVQFPFKGFDSVWTKIDADKITELTVDFPPLRMLRGVYTWGWREHPPRIHFLQPVFEMVNAHTGLVELEPQGRSYAERNRALTVDDIGEAAPEMKMHRVAEAVLNGATPAEVAAMLGNAAVAPRGTWQDWADLAADQLQVPDEAWDVLAAEGLGPGDFGPYRFISVYMNNEMYGRGRVDKSKIEGWNQGDRFQVKLVNLDDHGHYFRNVDFGPRLHDDITAADFPSGSHSFEIMNFKPTYGAPKVAEVQWRAGWGFRPHFDVIQQADTFSRMSDRALWRHYYDGTGAMRFGWQYSQGARGGDFAFNPPPFIIGSTAHPSADQLREGNRVAGLVIGRHTEGYGVAKMCAHAEHPLGGFCQTDISAFNPHGARNVDTDGDGTPDVLWFPPFLRNPDPASGGDIIPPTPAWKPFLWINPANGTLQLDPADPSAGYWADLTYSHGTPVAPGGSLSATIEAPRAAAQVFYQFDDLYHDNAIFSPHPILAPVTAPAENLGFGLPGTGGRLPFLSITGSLATGGTADVALSDAAPNAFAVLFASAGSTAIPVGGSTFVPAEPLFLFVLRTDTSGNLSFVANGGGGPIEAFAQFAIEDFASPTGFSLSNALSVHISP